MQHSHTPQGKARRTPSRAAARDAPPPRTFFASVINRELAPRRISVAALLPELSCDEDADVYTFGGGPTQAGLPFCPRYCPWPACPTTLGVADEDGCMTLVDAAQPAEAPDQRRWRWRAHRNAVFDFAWSPAEGRLLTASGDQTCALWDISRCGSSRDAGEVLAARRRRRPHRPRRGRSHRGRPRPPQGRLLLCRGHRGSVKSVAARPADPHVFASGSRDGCILVYDVRQGGEPVMALRGVHEPSPPSAAKRKRGGLPNVGHHGVRSPGHGVAGEAGGRSLP